MIQQLQEQISDLSLYLEEERVNHRQTKQKVRPRHLLPTQATPLYTSRGQVFNV